MVGFLLSVFLLTSTAMVVVSSQTMHAILFLVFCFVNVALLFVFIGAEFVAFLLLIGRLKTQILFLSGRLFPWKPDLNFVCFCVHGYANFYSKQIWDWYPRWPMKPTPSAFIARGIS